MNLQMQAIQTSAGENTPSPKLLKSAHEFEAILLQSWLEKMNHNSLGSEENLDPAHDTVSSLGTQAIATALAARGGVGIAAMLVRQIQTGQAEGVGTSGLPQSGQKTKALSPAGR